MCLRVALVLGCFASGAVAQTGLPDETARLLAAQMFQLPAVRVELGPSEGEPPARAVFNNGKLIGYVTSSWQVSRSVGYSGKPIDVLVAVDTDGHITSARLIEQSEPVLVIGISPEELASYVRAFGGYDLRRPLHDESGALSEGIPDALSGATVSSIVMRDAIIRAGRAIATTRGIIGSGHERSLKQAGFSAATWDDLVREGAIAHRRISIGEAGKALGTEVGSDAAATYISLHTALVTPARIGQNLLGQLAYNELISELGEGDQAILVAGGGLYSFKGTRYRRTGYFDRLELVQGGNTIRLSAEGYRNIRALTAEGTPVFREIGLFILPADSGFDPTAPWRLNLLASRDLPGGSVSLARFSFPYTLPESYVRDTVRPGADEAASASIQYWTRNWQSQVPGIAVLAVMLTVLGAILFFQDWLAERFRLYRIVRLSYLTATLFLLGWWLGAQLSVVHVISFVQALLTGGRGVFCGWLCPFGALQELLNELARKAGLRQLNIPFGLHERLWPLKYILFLALFAISLNSVTLAFLGAEIEPFKTVITLRFLRDWPFVLFALALLFIGLFVERFYCRYLCPLGGALAIPARLRMFDWLKRRKQCGVECGVCARRCTVQAIHPDGRINPNECIHCLHCQMLYFDERTCPPLIERAKRRKRREAVAARQRAAAEAADA